MNQNLTAIAKDNMVRISPTKLSLLVNSIVNMKASSAINQLQFSSKRISRVILKVLNAAIAAFKTLRITLEILFEENCN